VSRTIEQIEQQFALQSKQIDLLEQHWRTMIAGQVPKRKQFGLWLRLNRNDLDTILTAIDATARKNLILGYDMGDDDAIRYASGCMKSITLRAAA
jgi:hypothetical protein